MLDFVMNEVNYLPAEALAQAGKILYPALFSLDILIIHASFGIPLPQCSKHAVPLKMVLGLVTLNSRCS